MRRFLKNICWKARVAWARWYLRDATLFRSANTAGVYTVGYGCDYSSFPELCSDTRDLTNDLIVEVRG